MISRRAAVGTTRRRALLRRPPVAAVCLFVAVLLAFPVQGSADLQEPHATPSTSGLGPLQAASDSDDAAAKLRAAAALADEGELDRARAILSDALDRWLDHPGLLAALAGLCIRQGRHAEAEALAARLIRIVPASDHGWELLAASRYLQDDTRGALRAWRHRRPPLVREIEVRVLAHDGPRASDAGTDPIRLTGIAEGRPLTEEALVRGERRLAALPAASRSRLGYRALSGADAAIEGTVVLGTSNPFTFPDLAAHGIRILSGRIHVASADPLGRLERWELSGAVEGTLRSVGLAVAHPAPHGPGVWRWAVDHRAGRYASARGDDVVREERSGIAWSHVDWITARLRGSGRARIDVRPGRGTFAGAGVGWTLLSLTGRGSVRAEATGWTKVGGAADGGGGSGAARMRLEEAIRFGRLSLRASLHPPDPRGAAAPSGVSLRGGVVAASTGLPRDLLPRAGAGGNTSLLMRARSDLDDQGVVRPLVPGRTWAHGGVEVLRSVGEVGPVGIGVAAFADGVRALAAPPGSADPATRRGAVHLGAGVRARIPGVTGWLRADWGIDPVDGASTISAAWVSGGPP